MFRISLHNIGVDMVTKDIIAAVDTRVKAASFAFQEVLNCIGGDTSEIQFRCKDVYEVYRAGNCVGSIEIVKL